MRAEVCKCVDMHIHMLARVSVQGFLTACCRHKLGTEPGLHQNGAAKFRRLGKVGNGQRNLRDWGETSMQCFFIHPTVSILSQELPTLEKALHESFRCTLSHNLVGL